MKDQDKDVLIRNSDGSVRYNTIKIPVVESIDDIMKEYSEEKLIELINDSRIMYRTIRYRNILRNERRHAEQFSHWPSFGVMTTSDKLSCAIHSMTVDDIKKAIESFSFRSK